MTNGDQVLSQFTEEIAEKTACGDRKLRIGIIGTGWIARAHVQQYVKFPDVEIVAMADLIPGKCQAFCERNEVDYTNIHFYPDHKSMLEQEKLDAILR